MKANNKVIVINGRFLSQRTTGVQRFAREMVCALDLEIQSLSLPITFELLVPSNAKTDLNLSKITVHKVGTLTGHLWEQLDLPRFARGKILICLCNTAPLFSIATQPVYSTVHDVSFTLFPKTFSTSFRLFYKFLIPLILRWSAKIFTVSFHEKLQIESRYPFCKSRVLVNYPGAISLYWKNKACEISREKKTILFVGSINPRKNIAGLLKAYQLVLRSDPEVKLKIVGASHQSFTTDGLGNLLSNKNVEFFGSADDKQLIQFYQTSTLLAFPSLYEGFGLPPLEAMFFGCPVLVARASCLPEVCGDAAIYCDPLQPSDIAEKILLLLRNPTLREDLASKGLKHHQKYSWPLSARRLLSHLLKS